MADDQNAPRKPLVLRRGLKPRAETPQAPTWTAPTTMLPGRDCTFCDLPINAVFHMRTVDGEATYRRVNELTAQRLSPPGDGLIFVDGARTVTYLRMQEAPPPATSVNPPWTAAELNLIGDMQAQGGMSLQEATQYVLNRRPRAAPTPAPSNPVVRVLDAFQARPAPSSAQAATAAVREQMARLHATGMQQTAPAPIPRQQILNAFMQPVSFGTVPVAQRIVRDAGLRNWIKTDAEHVVEPVERYRRVRVPPDTLVRVCDQFGRILTQHQWNELIAAEERQRVARANRPRYQTIQFRFLETGATFKYPHHTGALIPTGAEHTKVSATTASYVDEAGTRRVKRVNPRQCCMVPTMGPAAYGGPAPSQGSGEGR